MVPATGRPYLLRVHDGPGLDHDNDRSTAATERTWASAAEALADAKTIQEFTRLETFTKLHNSRQVKFKDLEEVVNHHHHLQPAPVKVHVTSSA